VQGGDFFDDFAVAAHLQALVDYAERSAVFFDVEGWHGWSLVFGSWSLIEKC
jgi:hypothetical protein